MYGSFFIPFIILVGIFINLQVWPFGKKAFLPIDSFGQYVPFIEYFGNVLGGKSSLFYSLGKSLGGEMYGLFAYYLVSPYNLLVLVFKNITFVLNLILILKISSLGPTFFYLLNRRKEAKFTNLIFSSLYSLSVVSITYGFNIMWLDSMILLPLVIAGLEDLIKLKKTRLYTIALSLTLITNYYMGFMVCIFSVIYFIYKTILEKEVTKKEILKTILRFFIFSVISICIASIILIPAFIGLQNGRAEFGTNNLNFDKNFLFQDGLSKFFTNSFELKEIANNAMPPVFCGVIINFLVILFFMNNKIKLKEKIITFIVFLIFFISFYISGANLLWAMGNIPAFYIYRYTFCFVFMYILIAARSYENIKNGTRTWHTILTVFIYEILGIIVIKFNLGVANILWVRIDMCLVLLFGLLFELSKLNLDNTKILLKLKKKKIISLLILIIAISNIAINDVYIMKILANEAGPTNIEDYDYIKSYYKFRHDKIKEYDNSIFRIESKINTSLNDGIVFEDNGINHSSSTYSKSLYTFLKKLGYSQEHVSIVNDIANTRAMDMLFGIKYKIEKPKNSGAEEEIRLNQNLKMYKNKYCLNLGFSVSESVLENAELSSKNAFICQNNLLKKIANLDEEIYIQNKGELIENTENLRKNDEGIYKKIDGEKAGKLIYEFEIEHNKEVYFYISEGFNLDEVKIYINEEALNRSPRGSLNKMIDLGKFEKGEKVKVELELKDEPMIALAEDIYIYYEDEEILQKYYDALSKEQIDLTKINDANYKGNIKIESDKNEYVLFTIPYDKGWKATVDGKETEVIKIQGELMGVKTGKGEHVIELKFVPEGFYVGACTSAFGLAIFILAMIVCNTKRG